MENSKNESFLKKVMVVDDNESDRYIAEFLISREKFSAETILMESAPKALQYLRSIADASGELPQLIFLDIKMPEMDGFDFLEEFKNFSESVRKQCTIIMLSSSMDPEDQKRAGNDPDVHGFINKPLDKGRLNDLRSEISLLKFD